MNIHVKELFFGTTGRKIYKNSLTFMYMNNILCVFTKKFGSELMERTVIGLMDLLLTFMGENINCLRK